MREIVELGAGAALTIELAEGTQREPDDAVFAVDLSNLAGARILARRAYALGETTVRVLCAAAPAGGWATGIEEIVLGRATQLARDALERETPGRQVTRFDVGARQARAGGFDQAFTGTVVRGGDTLGTHGRHWLGFADQPRRAILCTTVCSEPQGAGRCEGIIASAAPTGAWLEPPTPSLFARAMMAGAQHPWPALGLVGCMALAASSVILARRPRPRP